MKKGGRNPWLRIPVSDYEGHMGHPAVQQLPYLSAVFQEVLLEFQPKDIAVLGCSTGNGFEHIPTSTRKIIGVDINPQYLDVVRQRYGDRLPGLDLICADIFNCTIAAHSIDLIHGALIFEYVDPAPAMERVATWLRPGGVFSAVLQLPSADGSPVTETP
jgi:SAM-dependent methyltransferase